MIFFLTISASGGVGRVIGLLGDSFAESGLKVKTIEIANVPEKGHFIYRKLLMLCAAFCSRILKDSDKSSVFKFKARRLSKYLYLKKQFKGEKQTVISFLNEPIFLSLLCCKHIDRLIVSERNDPEQFTENRTTMAFIRTMYPKADLMVCQSPDAKKWYDKNSDVKSAVIFNPVKTDLPARFAGKRQNRIVNFCRISSQKNLPLLIDAFALFCENHSNYSLEIIGDEEGNGAAGETEKVKAKIKENGLEQKVLLLPGMKDVHSKIINAAMFVSSSDFEGMSNSMLEAMAIGLPTICTDCPAGGARAIIKDHENGILVPVGDADALAKAMTEVVENAELAEKLSRNGTKIRETQSLAFISQKWLNIINKE